VDRAVRVRIATEAECDERTVRALVEGRPVRPLVAIRIERAAAFVLGESVARAIRAEIEASVVSEPEPEPTDAAAEREKMIARQFGPQAVRRERERANERAKLEALEQTEAIEAEVAADRGEPSPEDLPAIEQTWHAVIETGLGEPYVEEICLVVNGRPSPVHRVCETDSGVYGPSIEQAHLIEAAPELYRAASDLHELTGTMLASDATAAEQQARRRAIDAARGRAREAMAKATGKLVPLKRRSR
jgi:hypothetical protein